jgi:hypothetical protein
MRKLSLTIALALISGLTLAAIKQVTCSECRDPKTNWLDYGNFAYNQVFGAKATLGLSEGSKMTVVNPQERWALVDLDFVLESSGLTAMLGFLSLEIPSVPEAVQITVYTDTGEVFSSKAIPNGLSLIVGEPVADTGTSSSGSSTSGGSSLGYTTVPSTFRYHFNDGSSGTVSICNPDVRGDCRGA